MGDFNADLGLLGGPKACTEVNEQGKIFHRYLRNFVSTHLRLQTSSLSYTYESEAHSTQSTIDHIICPRHMLPRFQSALSVVDHPLNTSDHHPILAIFNIPSQHHLLFRLAPRLTNLPIGKVPRKARYTSYTLLQ